MIERLRFDERRVTLRLLVLALLATTAPAAHAQVVRGTVRDDASGAPLAGVVVSIQRHGEGQAALPASLARVTAGLTDAQGEYALAAGDSGRFVVTAKRIGVRQYVSPPLALSLGQTRQLDIRLEGVRFELPTVVVSTATPCGTREGDRGRIAALWAEASAALTASELSLRDRLFHASIERYERVLEARTLSVRTESRDTRRSVTEHAFVSFPAESLAVVGYARTLDDGTIEHFAPDAQVLLSDAFVRDHCFGLAKATGTEVGITFQPVRQRRVADIEGTIWLDARSYELHRVSFRYTNFPLPIRDARSGGEVQFEHLATGAWYVSRWYMRVPQVAMEPFASGTRRAPMATTMRAVVSSFREVGGRVVADERPASSVALASLNGRVIDSTGAGALADARVSLLGMSLTTTTGRDGAFTLDSIPPGSYTLLVEHPTYTRLGLTAGEQSLEIGDAPSSITLVRAIDTPQILRQLCGYDEVPDTLVAVRLVVPTSRSGPKDTVEARQRSLHLTWGRPREVTPGVYRTLNMATDLPVDAAGGATACMLPRDIRLGIEELNPDGTTGRQWQVFTPRRGFLVMELGADQQVWDGG